MFYANAHADPKAKSNGYPLVDEWTLKMEYFILELMNDNYVILNIFERNVDLSVILHNCIQKRHVPRVTNFTETIVPLFLSKNFCMHFRIDRGTFEIIMQAIAPRLICNNVCGKEQEVLEKQFLLFLWYISNQESMRESANLFGISKSTVHETIMNVCHVFNQTFKIVSNVFDYRLIVECKILNSMMIDFIFSSIAVKIKERKSIKIGCIE